MTIRGPGVGGPGVCLGFEDLDLGFGRFRI
jgi:hypothetical protein